MSDQDRAGPALGVRQDRASSSSRAGCTSSACELVSSGGTADGDRRRRHPGHRRSTTSPASPAILDHRVVTLHPKIHGGILADRDEDSHRRRHEPATASSRSTSSCRTSTRSRTDPGIETIDIGGPAMVRAAAKNHACVAHRHRPVAVRRRARRAARQRRHASATTPAARSRSRRSRAPPRTTPRSCAWLQDGRGRFPQHIVLALERTGEALRYGENPHQHGARYRISGTTSWWDDVEQHAASRSATSTSTTPTPRGASCTTSVDRGPRCAIIKHANPCGVAVADDLADRVPARARVRRALRVRRDRRAQPPDRRRDRRARWSPARRPTSSSRPATSRATIEALHREAQEHPPARGAGRPSRRRSTSARSAAASSCRTPHHFAAAARRLARRHQAWRPPTSSGATPSWRGASAGT